MAWIQKGLGETGESELWRCCCYCAKILRRADLIKMISQFKKIKAIMGFGLFYFLVNHVLIKAEVSRLTQLSAL